MAEAGLVLGAVSLAFDALHGIRRGCEIFVDAANIPADLASLRLRLLFEYCKLIDWADLVGLAQPEDHRLYEVRVKANRAVVYAVLCELRTEFHSLSSIADKYLAKPAEPATASRSGDTGSTKEQSRLPSMRTELSHQEYLDFAEILDFDDALESSNGAPRIETKGKRMFSRLAAAGKGTVLAGKDIALQPRRIVWAVHHKDAFREHLSRVQELTSYLQHTSDVATQQRLIEMGREACLSLVSMSRVQDNLVTGQEHVQLALSAIKKQLDSMQANVSLQSTIDIRLNHPAAMEHSPDFEKLLKFSLFRQEVELAGDTSGATEHRLEDVVLDPGYAQERRSVATLRSSSVVIEWKQYTPVPNPDDDVDPSAPPVPKTQTVRSVRQLCATLERPDRPTELHLPPCLGFVHDRWTHRFGFVFQQTAQATSEIALDEAFKGKSPGLADRLNAAASLVTSLLYLHAVGWLHKDISSANVIMSSYPSAEPWGMRLSGFEYARSDDMGYTTTDPESDPEGEIYRHPEFQGPDKVGYRKTFDIYSLGIVLIEIAYWQPIWVIMGIELCSSPYAVDSMRRALSPPVVDPSRKALSPVAGSRAQSRTSRPLAASPENLQDIRRRILNEASILGGVRKRMGDRYYQAVEACIRGGKALNAPNSADGEAQPMAGTLIQMAYTKRVVGVLQAIVV